MIRRVVLLAEVKRDLQEAYSWYEERSPGLGAEFLRNVEACLSLTVRNPEIRGIVFKNYRRALVRRFPFAVFYEAEKISLVVYAAFHCSQHPARWRRRFKAR